MLGNPPGATATDLLEFENIQNASQANTSLRKQWVAPYACQVTIILGIQTTQPNSATGTVQATITKGVAGVTMLAVPFIDLELQVADLNVQYNLSVVAADTLLAGGDIIEFIVASTSADMTSPGNVAFELIFNRV